MADAAHSVFTPRIDIERGIPVGQPDGVKPDVYARAATLGLKMLKRVPGLK